MTRNGFTRGAPIGVPSLNQPRTRRIRLDRFGETLDFRVIALSVSEYCVLEWSPACESRCSWWSRSVWCKNECTENYQTHTHTYTYLSAYYFVYHIAHIGRIAMLHVDTIYLETHLISFKIKLLSIQWFENLIKLDKVIKMCQGSLQVYSRINYVLVFDCFIFVECM